MEIRFLETFLLVVETSSFAETARRLNVTPAAVTQRVRALEGEIGAALVRRAGHAVRPTESGLAVVDLARDIVRDAQSLKLAANGERDSGNLRLGVINSAVTGLLPDVLARLREHRPNIDLYMLPGISTDLYRKLVEGDLDAALIVRPHFKMPKSFDWLSLRIEPLILLAPAGTETGDPHELLRKSPFIRYDRNHWGGRLADLYLRQHGIRTREQFELDSLDAIAVLVDRGLGVSVVPDWAPPWPAGLSLCKAPLEGALAREIGLVWPRTSPKLRLVQTFAREAMTALGIGGKGPATRG